MNLVTINIASIAEDDVAIGFASVSLLDTEGATEGAAVSANTRMVAVSEEQLHDIGVILGIF